MNFLQFLEECKSNEKNKEHNNVVENNQTIILSEKKTLNLSTLITPSNVNMYYTEFKIGDFVTIIRSEKDNRLNYYKGYIGEIKSYSKFSNNAYVILDALHSNKVISFPIEHLKLRKFSQAS
jgi:ribosomal protein L21E